ncbi:unnamed protein product [Diamesa serratosioi]
MIKVVGLVVLVFGVFYCESSNILDQFEEFSYYEYSECTYNTKKQLYLSKTKESWTKSVEICQSFGLNLVTFKMKDEKEYILNLWEKSPMKENNVWIGYTDTPHQGLWVSHDGQLLNDKNTFKAGELRTRDNGSDEHCLEIVKQNDKYKYNINKCSNEYHFICEKNEVNSFVNDLKRELKKQTKNFTEIHDKLKSEIDSLNAKNNELESKFQNKEREVTKLESKLKEQEREFETEKATLNEEHGSKVNDLNEKITELIKHNGGSLSNYANCEAEIQTLKDTHKAKESQLQNNMNTAKKDLEKAETERDKAKDEIVNKNAEIKMILNTVCTAPKPNCDNSFGLNHNIELQQYQKGDDDVDQVNIYNGNMERLSNAIFSHFTSLDNLNIVNSSVKYITQGVFNGASRLKHSDCFYNTTKKWYISKIPDTWLGASEKCKSLNMQLASLSTKEDKDRFLKINDLEKTELDAWIGHSEVVQKSLERKNKIQPNSPILRIDKKSYKFENEPRTEKHLYICESVNIVNITGAQIAFLEETIRNITIENGDLKENNTALEDQVTSLTTNKTLMVCTYSYINKVYSCSIEGFKIEKENEDIKITGAHKIGKRDTDVIELNVSKSKTKLLTNEFFHTFDKLRNIQIIKSELGSLSDGVFGGAVYLRKVFIEGNNIKSISENAFKGADNLNVLNLDNNQIEFVATGAFKELPYLTILNLNNNKLKKIPTSVLKGLVHLMYLKASGNKFEKLDGDLLKSNKMLREAWFDNNKISNIGSDLLNYSDQLQRGVFSGNICIDNDSENTCLEAVKNDIFEKCVNYDPKNGVNPHIWARCPKPEKPETEKEYEDVDDTDEDYIQVQ